MAVLLSGLRNLHFLSTKVGWMKLNRFAFYISKAFVKTTDYTFALFCLPTHVQSDQQMVINRTVIARV